MLVSDVVKIKKPVSLSTEILETILINRFGSIIRWAIIGIEDDELKLCITYEKGSI